MTNKQNGTWTAFPVGCQKWTCSTCSKSKLTKLRLRVKTGWYLKWGTTKALMLTLTYKINYPGAVTQSIAAQRRAQLDTKEFHALMNRHLAELVRWWRNKWGELEYFATTEVTKRGTPHYHLIIPEQCMPRERGVADAISKKWLEITTDSHQIDIRGQKRGWKNCLGYLIKYISKQNHAANYKGKRVYRRSRGFPMPDIGMFESIADQEGKALPKAQYRRLYGQMYYAKQKAITGEWTTQEYKIRMSRFGAFRANYRKLKRYVHNYLRCTTENLAGKAHRSPFGDKITWLCIWEGKVIQGVG